MKFLSTEQLGQADAATIASEPISSLDLMERAAGKWLDKMKELYPEEKKYIVCCGMGNNGGDGLVVARKLFFEGLAVRVYVVRHSEKGSPDFETNLARLPKEIPLVNCIKATDFQQAADGIIIDAMLGSGLNRPLVGLLAEIAECINSAKARVLAIDLPSGIYDRHNTPENRAAAVKAATTITFQNPKLCMVCPEDSDHIGDWHVVDIGLDAAYIESCETPFYLFDEEQASHTLHKRSKESHKGIFGHALLAAGSKGKIGAAVLAAEACLRSGVGLLTVAVPACGYPIIQSTLPEAMVLIDSHEEVLSEVFKTESYRALGIGPGIGKAPETILWLENLLKNSTKPLVLDADALNILSDNEELVKLIPQGSVLTPHPKEFERLFGPTKNSEEAFDKMIWASVELQVVIVRKGHHTAVSYPNGTCWFNSTGNAGMAKGGSGDALTGVILALLAQGYSSQEAASLGVYLHGLAGDFAADKEGVESMLPSDLIHHLGAAFQAIHRLRDK